MRSHYCGEITESLLGQHVELCGWVHNRRDHGGVIFLDVRDREGIVQVVYQPDTPVFQLAEQLRHEYVIQIKGQVRERPEGMINPNLPTGKVEILGSELKILNRSEPLPFFPGDYTKVSENLRMQYRYIDLRRPDMQSRLMMRAKVIQLMRRYFDHHGFIDIETPMLTKATPEGARDYLVPSRVQKGSFYALPQSPQLFKQILMMSGSDRYYQIVRCFRDEDLRADRQPEFTQLDVELSFTNEQEIQSLMEKLLRHIFKEVLNVQLPDPFPRMSYKEAMHRFGSDKPDLRIPLELVEISDLVKEVDFKVFAGPANDPEGRVCALRLPRGNKLSRKELDDYGQFVGIYGAKGLAYIKVNQLSAGVSGLQSPILKFLPEATIMAILDRVGAANDDVIFFGADRANIVNESMGALRIKLGHDCQLVEKGWKPLWVVDWPMFEKHTEGGTWQPLHHPFTAPNVDDLEKLRKDPGGCLSRAYDMVLNGSELGGGSIRIHNSQMQQDVFEILGINPQESARKIWFSVRSVKIWMSSSRWNCIWY